MCRMSQQTGRGCRQIPEAIIRDIGDCLCECVWRLSKGDINPPMLGLSEVEYLHERAKWANEKVSDGSQPPMTFDLSLSESAGSRSLHRLVRCSLPQPR